MSALCRNNTSYPTQLAAKLRALYDEFLAAKTDETHEQFKFAQILKYYQFICRTIMSDPEYGVGNVDNGRGLLIYASMGMGKTRLAVAVAMALWNKYNVIVILPKSLQENMCETVRTVAKLTGQTDEEAETAVNRFNFVSSDAYNAAVQLEKFSSLEGKLVIIDEAHNFFRGIINSGAEESNARRIYDMIMAARNVRLLFLTGTPASKNPFELVPCFNMLAGYELLPSHYELFCKYFVDFKSRTVKNADRLANRLVGLVSHVSAYSVNEIGQTIDKKARDDGWFPEELPMVVVKVEQSEEQFKQYLKYREIEEKESKLKKVKASRGVLSGPALSLPSSEKGGNTYYVKSRSCSNYHFIDGTFSADESPKMEKIAQQINECPGLSLVYSQFVNTGGLGSLEGYLQKLGFTPAAGAPQTRPLRTAAQTRPTAVSLQSSTITRKSAVGESAPPGAQGEITTKDSIAKNDAELAVAIGHKGRHISSPNYNLKAYDIARELAITEHLRKNVIETYNDAEWKVILKTVARGLEQFDFDKMAYYDPKSVPEIPYREGKSGRVGNCKAMTVSKIMNLHHGQRKLLNSEVECLTQLLSDARQKVTIVYAGSAPGVHLTYFLTLFPNAYWILYDPATFYAELHKSFCAKNFELHNEYFTDEVAAKYTGKCDIFISDIRLNPDREEDFENNTRRDMKMQAKWTKIINPRLGSMLKYRMPYNLLPGEHISYMPGKIYLQMWPSACSAEARLISTNAEINSPDILIDVKHYEDWFAQHNMLRMWHTFAPPEPMHVDGYDRCFDCTCEAYMWKRYREMPGAARMSISDYMIKSTKITHQGLINIVKVANSKMAATSGMKMHGHVAEECAPTRIMKSIDTFCGISGHANSTQAPPKLEFTPPSADLVGVIKATTKKTGKTTATETDNTDITVHGGADLTTLVTKKSNDDPTEPFTVQESATSPSQEASLRRRPQGRAQGESAAPSAGQKYAVISGETPMDVRAKIKEIFNSDENKHGDLIRVLLISKSGAEGLDLKNLREIHILEPYWDKARVDQVRARGVRMGSHDDLPYEERVVQAFIYISTANKKFMSTLPDSRKIEHTIDEEFYDNAARQFEINETFRKVLRSVSIECDVMGREGCRTCAPTNVQLFDKSAATDLTLPDPCKARETTEIEAIKFTHNGTDYYYREDKTSIYGYTFYKFDTDLDSYTAVDPSDAIISDLLAAIQA